MSPMLSSGAMVAVDADSIGAGAWRLTSLVTAHDRIDVAGDSRQHRVVMRSRFGVRAAGNARAAMAKAS